MSGDRPVDGAGESDVARRALEKAFRRASDDPDFMRDNDDVMRDFEHIDSEVWSQLDDR